MFSRSLFDYHFDLFQYHITIFFIIALGVFILLANIYIFSDVSAYENSTEYKFVKNGVLKEMLLDNFNVHMTWILIMMKRFFML